MKKNRASFINIGFSSIVMVFIMICLVTFATLSVLTAHSDYRLSKKLADKTTAYYQADAIARDTLAIIDENLYNLYISSSSVNDFYGSIAKQTVFPEMPANVRNITIENTQEPVVISYTVPISEVQTLYVSLKINYPTADSECFTTITRWQTVTDNAPDESDDFLNLYTGNE